MILLYTVQQNFSGWIHEHYYSEIYNIESFEMSRYKYVFDLIETDNYFAYLKFDEKRGINKIEIEIYSIDK